MFVYTYTSIRLVLCDSNAKTVNAHHTSWALGKRCPHMLPVEIACREKQRFSIGSFSPQFIHFIVSIVKLNVKCSVLFFVASSLLRSICVFSVAVHFFLLSQKFSSCFPRHTRMFVWRDAFRFAHSFTGLPFSEKEFVFAVCRCQFYLLPVFLSCFFSSSNTRFQDVMCMRMYTYFVLLAFFIRVHKFFTHSLDALPTASPNG